MSKLAQKWEPLPNGLYRAETNTEHPTWPTAIEVDNDLIEVSNTGFRLRSEYRLCELVDEAEPVTVPVVPAEVLQAIDHLRGIVNGLAILYGTMPLPENYDWQCAQMVKAWLAEQEAGDAS